MGFTNFPNGVTSLGVPIVGGSMPFTYGTYFFVDADNGSDGNTGLERGKALKTVAAAYAKTTTNCDDVIVLSTNAVHTLSSMLDVTKNRVHFIGDPWGRRYGQRARLYMGVTTDTSDVHMVRVLGVGNTFTGIKFWNANTLTQNTACVAEGGEYNTYYNCEFYDSTKLTSDTHCELLLGGDSAQFFNCTFGSLADSVSGDKVRPAVLVDGSEITGGAGTSRDILFDNCRFWKNAGGTSTAMVKVVADADLERLMEFHNCQFIANQLGSTPAVAIALGASLTSSYILLTGDTSGFDVTKLATGTGVISCLNVKVATATIGVQAT